MFNKPGLVVFKFCAIYFLLLRLVTKMCSKLAVHVTLTNSLFPFQKARKSAIVKPEKFWKLICHYLSKFNDILFYTSLHNPKHHSEWPEFDIVMEVTHTEWFEIRNAVEWPLSGTLHFWYMYNNRNMIIELIFIILTMIYPGKIL